MRWPKTWVLYILSLAVMAIITALVFTKLPPQAPLFYSLPEPKDHIVDIWLLGILPGLSLIFVLFNQFLNRAFFQREHIISYVLRITNDILVIAITVIFVKIVLLIT